MKKIKLTWLSLTVMVLGFTVVLPNTVLAGRGFYVVDRSARPGMIVSLTQNPGVVEPASDKDVESLIGVIGASATDLDIQPGQVAVQTEGVVQTLVSTITGDIAVGDRIAPSSIVGFGSKLETLGWVVGTAQASLNATTEDAIKTTVKDTTGKAHEVYAATIPVLVRVMYFSSTQQATNSDDTSSVLPKSVQSIADSIAGKRASVVAVVLAFILILVGLVISGYIINSTVRNGIQAIGRQPLAKQMILRRMLQTVVLAVSLLISMIIGALIVVRVL